MELTRIILTLLLPPLGVYLEVGKDKQFWLNLLLTFLGYVPGILHAVYILKSRPDKMWV